MSFVYTPIYPQPVATTAVALAVGNLRPYNATSGPLAPTLPILSNVRDGSVVIVEKDSADASSNPVTVTCAGSDTLAGGATTTVLTMPGERVEYQASTISSTRVWKVMRHSVTRAGSDSRYQQASRTLFGTLGAEQVATTTQNLTDLANSGFRVAMFEANWHNMQQGVEGVDTSSWVTDWQTRLAALQTAGFQLTLETGHFNQPDWVTGLDASYFHTKFTGATVTNLNLTWSAAARLKWQSYVDHLHTNFDLSSFSAIRIGASGAGELLYPSGSFFVGNDAAAQTGVGLAAGQSVTPFPGWTPGGTDTSLSAAQVTQWLDWYVQSLVNQAVWMMTYLRNKGFAGWFEILMPGQGTRPSQEVSAIPSYLPTSAGGGTISRAALWHRIIQKLPNTGDIRVHLSSVADQSGSPVDNVGADTDQAIGLSVGGTVNNWSATRWVSYLAKKYGYPISMENVGFTGGFTHYYDTSSTGLPAETFAAVDSFKPDVLYWAHASDLFGAGHLAPLSSVVGPAVSNRMIGRQVTAPSPPRGNNRIDTSIKRRVLQPNAYAAESVPRSAATITSRGTLASGRMSVVAIELPVGLTINKLIFHSGTTALATGSNQWFCLLDQNRNQLAVTADDTSTAWASNTAKALSLATPFTTAYAGLYYLGVVVVATTVPSLVAIQQLGYIAGLAPVLSGTANTALTNPASCPATAQALAVVGDMLYAAVS